MASHVVITDSSFRRTTIKTTPGKYLSDVLQEVCTKLGLNAEQYALKYNKKPLDLSRTVRLSGLASGAQLELVQSSRSPSVVSVALQLPQSENGVRLTDKFPSSTSLWQILRRFESGTAGKSESSSTSSNLNFTQRGTPAVSDGGATGSGRLHYEMPVLDIMGRQMASFTDLQKTLAQLGLNSGSVLLRLSFKNSGRPLEEAMADISLYFKDVEQPPAVTEEAHGAHADSVGDLRSAPEPPTASTTEDIAGLGNPPEPTPMEDAIPNTETTPTSGTDNDASTSAEKRKASDTPTPTPTPTDSSTLPENALVGPDYRPLTIYAPSTSPTPAAALHSFDEADYEPTVDHAKLHQSRLNSEGRNRRLASDSELAAQEKARTDRLAAVNEVIVRVRLPDQTLVESTFSRLDTAAALYGWVRQLLAHGGQPFVLRYAGPRGGQVELKEGTERLVPDLGWRGRVLVNFAWEEGADATARRDAPLKREWSERATELRVQAPVEGEERGDENRPVGGGGVGEGAKGKEKQGGGADRETRMKKLLGRLSKK